MKKKRIMTQINLHHHFWLLIFMLELCIKNALHEENSNLEITSFGKYVFFLIFTILHTPQIHVFHIFESHFKI